MAINLAEKEQLARKRVCLALDGIDSTDDAMNLACELSPYIGLCKVGKELHTKACNVGVPIINRIWRAGMEVFLDLKFHDTPATVYEASIAATTPGVRMFNLHVSGGEAMCKKALEGRNKEYASIRMEVMKVPKPLVIGVTELTSLSDEDLAKQGLGIKYDALVRRRTELAREWGLDGVVCPASKAGALEKEFGADFLYITPGIQWAGKAGEGQKQLYTPDMAVRDCKNSILVIGSAITKAGFEYETKDGKKSLVKKGASEDRINVAYQILQAMAKEM